MGVPAAQMSGMTSDILTPRLQLRPLASSDAAATSALITPDVSRWTASWPAEISVEEAQIRIAEGQARAAEGLLFARAIVRISDGALMGWISVGKPTVAARLGTMGYWIGEAYQARGYMTEAVRAFMPRVWTALDVDVIEAGAQPGNAASLSILQGLGMRRLGDREDLAPVRNRMEICAWYALDRPKAVVPGVP